MEDPPVLPTEHQQIAAGVDLTRPTERLAEERERISTEYRALLVGERGWSAERFGSWLADAWTRLLLNPSSEPD